MLRKADPRAQLQLALVVFRISVGAIATMIE